MKDNKYKKVLGTMPVLVKSLERSVETHGVKILDDSEKSSRVDPSGSSATAQSYAATQSELLIKAACDSLLRALHKDRKGRLAFDILKTTGWLKGLPLEPEDNRTEEEKSVARRAKVLAGLFEVMVARGDAYGHPIDVSSMESVRNTLGLVPVENDEVS